mmetsp:Transcript_6013/g.12744  ORF Transcript_6013/g.12744 Transcript_6013/m.12744 type:complete len:230 (+) Transcript_6013:180-869(+)
MNLNTMPPLGGKVHGATEHIRACVRKHEVASAGALGVLNLCGKPSSFGVELAPEFRHDHKPSGKQLRRGRTKKVCVFVECDPEKVAVIIHGKPAANIQHRNLPFATRIDLLRELNNSACPLHKLRDLAALRAYVNMQATEPWMRPERREDVFAGFLQRDAKLGRRRCCASLCDCAGAVLGINADANSTGAARGIGLVQLGHELELLKVVHVYVHTCAQRKPEVGTGLCR